MKPSEAATKRLEDKEKESAVKQGQLDEMTRKVKDAMDAATEAKKNADSAAIRAQKLAEAAEAREKEAAALITKLKEVLK